ncbi:DNA adenine methylase [Corynebacterium aquatimens]|uniref:DNA adenine methylase n=2 Tax=Corynebacterium TaxID=1716 RepID=UPI001F19BCA7|nr:MULTISPECIES: DNA adenine methylase [Corynebacterium]
MASRISEETFIADPMCGTGAMSATFRSHGHRVMASDLMTYSLHHARVRLLLGAPPPFKGLGKPYPEVLSELNSTEPVQGLFYMEYSPAGKPVSGAEPRLYFTAENAMRIDGILRRLEEWAPFLTRLENSLLRHDLILAVNQISNIAGTYGHYRSTFGKGALARLWLTPTTFCNGRVDHVVTKGPAELTLLGSGTECVYLDPPYKKRQYAANYHILETIAVGDRPTPAGASGLRNWWPQYSNFCSKTKIKDAFDTVFLSSEAPIFFISYSEDGLISDDQMRAILENHGRVERTEILNNRFKSNSAGKGGTVVEYLYSVNRG